MEECDHGSDELDRAFGTARRETLQLATEDEVLDILSVALRSWPAGEQHWEVLRLRFVEGLAPETIAKRVVLPEGLSVQDVFVGVNRFLTDFVLSTDLPTLSGGQAIDFQAELERLGKTRPSVFDTSSDVD
jgi:hypothetical protein